jgi:hypothetical protein
MTGGQVIEVANFTVFTVAGFTQKYFFAHVSLPTYTALPNFKTLV